MNGRKLCKAGGLLLAIQLVAGCASPPVSQAVMAGALPTGAAAAYALGDVGPGLSPGARAAIGQCLQAAGMRADTRPGYVVQVARTVRPAQTEVFRAEPDRLPAPPDAQPVPPARGIVETLTLTVTSIGTGTGTGNLQEVARVTATRRLPAKGGANGAVGLERALCGALAPHA